MIKSKVSVFARLKPKSKPKGKILYEINEAPSSKGPSVSKLTITNKKESSGISGKEKLKSICNKPIVLSFNGFLKNKKRRKRFLRR
jgi:hypothetical protein